MQLPQVNVIDAHALQGTVQFLFRLFRRTRIGLGRQVKMCAMLIQPGCDA